MELNKMAVHQNHRGKAFELSVLMMNLGVLDICRLRNVQTLGCIPTPHWQVNHLYHKFGFKAIPI